MESHDPTGFMGRLFELEKRLDIIEAGAEDTESYERHEKELLVILNEACIVAREAEACSDPHLDSIITEVDGLINNAIHTASQGIDPMFDFIPSFAHSGAASLVQDESLDDRFGQSVITGFMAILKSYSRVQGGEDLLKLPVPWNAATKPHACTTPLARFRTKIPPLSATIAYPLANVIYQARCEISCTSVCSPVQLLLSYDASCLSLISAGGYKNRTPVLSYWRLDNDSIDFPEVHDIEVGLEEISHHSAMDEQRKLIFVANEGRIKSFAWTSPSEHASGVGHGHSGLAVHTMDSSQFEGPLHVVNGRVFRAGHGSAAVWQIDALENHGPEGTSRIGKRFSIDDEWPDDTHHVECSSGSVLNQKIPFDDTRLKPWLWHPHPSMPGTMLCVSDLHALPSYSCAAVGLETGKTTGRYLGHSAQVMDISTSEADPSVFVTACGDGHARLYDTRHHLPMLTFDVGQQGDICPAAILCHPDGIPTIFTGTERREVIKLWDVRALSAVYELATGNNIVVGMAWDSTHGSLCAATECNYVDRLGFHHNYRKAKMPKSQRAHRHKKIQMGKMKMKKVIALTRMMTMKERGLSKHSMRKITLDIHLMPVIT